MAVRTITATGASPGVGLGRAWIYRRSTALDHPSTILPLADRAAEHDRLRERLIAARQDLEQISVTVTHRAGADEGAVFAAQALLLDDPAMLEPLDTAVRVDGLSATAAVERVFEEAARELAALDDPYLSARAADLRDVKERLIGLLTGKGSQELAEVGENVVIIARDLTPSDTAGLEPDSVRGIILVEGTPTAHATILARGLGLPLIIGAGTQLWQIQAGQEVLLDGTAGTVLVEPDEGERERFFQSCSPSGNGHEPADPPRPPASTVDGRHIALLANAASPLEARLAMQHGAEGIGLLRTEFLLEGLIRGRTDAPTEDELTAAYGAVFTYMDGKPIVVRVMDAGGDKPLPFLDFGDEANPFLGWRGIRVLLDRPELFALQTRAVLRAAERHGTDLRLMFPMISGVEEFVRARALVETVCDGGSYRLAHPLQIGAMIEVPSAALVADELAGVADFFSIGTNDLVQYLLACDRGNPRVSSLCDVSHPAVLRAIDLTVQAAHRAGIPVGVCGEAAGDPASIRLLLDLGVDELSVGPARLPEVRHLLQA